MVGYCSTGKVKAAMPPASMITMAITQAKTGRSMKKRDRDISAPENQAVQGLAQQRPVLLFKTGLRRPPQRHGFSERGHATPRHGDYATAMVAGAGDPDQACLAQMAQIAGDGAALQSGAFKKVFQRDLLLPADPDQRREFRDAKAAWSKLRVIEFRNALRRLAERDEIASRDRQFGNAPHEPAYRLPISH